MINYIIGTVADVAENQIIIETGGMGYEIYVSSRTLAEKGRIGDKVKLLTHLSVKEDGVTLFGFCCREEKTMFLRLITVGGVGAKLALAILSGIGLDELCSAIATAGSARLTQIKGVGKKTAERIVLELKDKIKGEYDLASSDLVKSLDEDAVLALLSMGFSKQEAAIAISKVTKENLTTEQIIMEALKR